VKMWRYRISFPDSGEGVPEKGVELSCPSNVIISQSVSRAIGQSGTFLTTASGLNSAFAERSECFGAARIEPAERHPLSNLVLYGVGQGGRGDSTGKELPG